MAAVAGSHTILRSYTIDTCRGKVVVGSQSLVEERRERAPVG